MADMGLDTCNPHECIMPELVTTLWACYDGFEVTHMRFFIFCFSIILCLVGSAQAQLPEQKATSQALPSVIPDARNPAPPTLLRFASQHVAIKAPLGWQSVPTVNQQAGTLASFTIPNAFGATLSLAYSEDPGRTRLPDDLPSQISAALAKRYPGFQALAKQRFTVQGADAWRIDGQLKPSSKEVVVRNRQVYLCREGRIYIVTMTCKKEDFERLAPSLDRLLKSMEWID